MNQAKPITFGSLFAGIGGLDLGLERVGMVCKWQVEIDDYATKVLKKHWPDVPKYRDIREFPPADGVESVDLICGGFPCQDISPMGQRAGINGTQSSLWSEMFRTICEVRPNIVIVENSSELTARGLDTVLADFSKIGFDAEWQSLPAFAFGAPHERCRCWIVANSPEESGVHKPVFGQDKKRLLADFNTWEASPWDEAAPKLCRVDDGLPDRVVRTECLGNAVVPQVAEFIGRCIVDAVEHERKNQ